MENKLDEEMREKEVKEEYTEAEVFDIIVNGTPEQKDKLLKLINHTK